MDKHYIDFANLSDKMKEKKAFKLSDVNGKIRKVAFDVVRFIDSEGLDRLWQIQSVGDEDYIVAMYDEAAVEKTAETKNLWRAIENGKGLDIFYKGASIGVIDLSALGFDSSDRQLAKEWVPVKLGNDESFVKHFISTLTASEKTNLALVAPELVRN